MVVASSKTLLTQMKEVVSRIRKKSNNFFKNNPHLLNRINNIVDNILDKIDLIKKEQVYDLPEIANALYRKSLEIDKVLNKRSSIESKELISMLQELKIVLSAAYYDFTGKIEIVKKAYKKYILAFTITLVLAPLFTGFNVLFIGFLMFPLLLSIHAYRARKRFGVLISSALFPLIVFICFQAVYYSIYSILNYSEINYISSSLNIPTTIAYIIVVAIGIIGTIGLVYGIYSFYILYKNMDAFT